MPILSVFFGIIVRMWHDDHPPPHIHVEYQGFEALVVIRTGEVSEGRLPRKAGRLSGDYRVRSCIATFPPSTPAKPAPNTPETLVIKA